ncbi:MAG: hypothetical protein ACRCYO_11255 [Bacteroidia bacterium]
MKVLSIIGVVLSLAGIIVCLGMMIETKCYCYCNDDFLLNRTRTPEDVLVGGSIAIFLFLFFLVFSIIATVTSFRKPAVVAAPPMHGYGYGNPYGQYQQPYQQPPPQQNPYQNPYNQNPPNQH